MSNQSKRLLTILLALFMILTSFPLNAFAASTETNVKNEITDIRTVGDKQVINLGTVKGQSRSNFGFFSGASRFLGFTTQQAGSSSETVAQKVEIKLETMGLNFEEDQFDHSALTEAGSFDVEITFQEVGGRKETRTMTFQAGETTKTETFYLPKDFGNGNVEAEIPKLRDNIALRVYPGGNSTTNFNLGEDMTYTFELTQIVHPVIDVKLVDPYGKELQESINQDLGLKLTLEDEHDFNLAANTKSFNIRTLSKFAGANIDELNSTGDNPTLSLTTALDENNRLTVGKKTYKLNKITYNALGQEVEIDGQKKKVGGYIEFATQPKIIVPTPDDSGDLPKTPDGYKRLSFHAESSSNAQDGRFEYGEKLKVIDVLEGTEYTDEDLQKEIKNIGQPTPIINGRTDDNKKFLKWKPELPTTGPVADTDFYPVYLANGDEITPGEKLPDGVFEVKVVKDDTIAADDLYGKTYAVFDGYTLARDKFPDLEAEKGHQNPKWTTEAEAPNTGMVDIKKPWTKEITKATTFKATAGADAATQIGQNGLKAVDTTALQGQELDEKFWHKGVELAENTPADKKDAFAALLKDATVTDLSNRSTTKVNSETGKLETEQVGKLLVTFKDGSTLEVPNQKLIVKPNTVEVSFDDKKAGDDVNAPRHNETVVKGKVSSKSGYPVKGAKVEIKDEDDKVIGITQVIDDKGNFKAGTRELKAGEKLTASVTLPDSKLAAESKPKTVKLNADRLKDLLPIAKTQKENFSKKQNAFIKKKLEALGTAIAEAEKLVDEKGKAKGEDTAKNQTAIDTAVTNLENALKALTANIPPSISGPKTHEIFVGEALDLKALVEVTDGDGADDLVVENGSNVKVEVKKVEGQTESPVADLATIKDTVGTYKVTYTAKDKAGAEVTHEMTLTVKPRTNSAIEVTTDPTTMKYLITEKGGKAKLNLKGMTLNLVDNLGKKTKVELTNPKVKFKVNGNEIKDGGDLTLNDDVKFIEVEYTDGDKTLTAKTNGVLRVGPDYDKDGTDDRTQDFDEKNINKLEVIKQPQLDYIAKDKSEDSKFKLNLDGMIIRMTDKAGKEKLAIVKEGKFYDYDEQTKEITGLTATPEHNAKLTPETSADDKGDNGKTVKITGPNNSEALTKPLKVFYDANGDGTPDYKEKTPAPSAMARNVGENPTGTTVEGMATPGAVIKITDKDGTVLTTEPTEVKAGPDGKYKATVKPILTDGTDIKVTAKLGEMAESDPTPTKVFDDKNDNKQPDRDEGFNIEKATDIKFVDQPDLTYLVATKDKEVTFDGKDAKGKAIYLELSYKNGEKTESKIMTLEELMKDTKNIEVKPANGTKDKIGNNPANLVGKAIEVKLKKVDPETATSKATSESTFAIEIDADGNGIADKDEKTPSPTAKALNVGKEPTSTTITGKAVPGAKVVAKVGKTVVGTTTADPTTGDYTIEATKTGKTDGGALDKDTTVKVTAKDGEKQTSDPTDAIVKEDKDGNGVDDDKEKFNIKKATKVEIIKNPDKMDYLVNTPEGKAKFETKGLVVKFTDDSGKSATYTAEELANMSDVTIKPANNDEIGLTPEGKTNKMDLTVTVTGAEANDKPTAKADRKVTVKLDADKNNKADEDEESAMPENVKAMNQNKVDPQTKEVTDKEKDTTTVTGKVKPGATVKITSEDGETDLTPSQVNIDNEGNFTAEITKQKVGTKIKVWATEPGKKISKPAPADVFRDSNNDGEDDSKAGQTERPAAIASNKGKNPAFTTIEGKTEKGAVITVTVKVNGEEKPVTVENLKVNDDGTYTLEAKYDNKPLENGAEIFVYAQNKPKTISKPQTTTVFNDVNEDGKPDGGKADLTDVKDIQVISPDKMSYTEGDTLVGTGLKAVVRDNAGNIEIFDYDNATGKFKDADGKVVDAITATVADKAIKALKLTEKDHNGKAIDVTIGEGEKAKKGSTNQTLEVKQLQTPTPTIEFAANQNTVGSDGKTPTGTAKQKTTVKFTVKNKPTTVYVKYTVNGEDKEESFDIGEGDELTKTVDLQVKLPVGTEVKVLAKDSDKTLSEAAKAKVVRDANNDGTADDKTPLERAKIDPIKAQSENITVTPPEGATELVIKETDKSGNTPEGSTPITVKKDKDGNWKIGNTPVEKDEETGKLTIPKGTFKLDEYNVVEVESKGDPETTTPSINREVVGKAKDTTAPAKPIVDQPVDGDKDIKVKTPTESDAKTITVEVKVPAKPGEDPTKKTVEVTKGDDGKWKTPDGKDVPEENGKLVIPVPEVKTGDKVTVEVKDESGNGSKSDPQEVVERQQLPEPTIDPIKTGGKTVSGIAKDAATVDIYKKVGNDYKLIKDGVAVGADGSYTYNDPTGFKDGDVIRVVAKKPAWKDAAAETTAGVDTSGLDKAIQDGKDALDPEKGGKNNGTKADKDLEKAIQEGEDIKKKTKPAPATQDEIDAAKDKIVKAIEEKKNTDKAMDDLKKAQDELDKAIKEAEKERKPKKDIKEAKDTNTKAKDTLDKKDKNSADIEKLIKEVEEQTKQMKKPVVMIDVVRAIDGEDVILIKTNPGYCTVKITISHDDGTMTELTTKTAPDGNGSVRLKTTLKAGEFIDVEAKDRDGNYLDGYTPANVNN